MNKQTIPNIFLSPAVELVLRWILGLSFVYASFHKIISPAQLAEVIYGYNLLPDFSINMIAVILPFLELFFGAALILGIYPRTAALGVSFILLNFSLAIIFNTIRGLKFDCGCFTYGQSPTAEAVAWLISRDIFFLIAGVYVLCFPYFRKWCVLQSGSLMHNDIIHPA